MPFIVSTSIAPSKLYARVDSDGDVLWQSNKARATRLDEAEADALAASINQYASTEALVEGAKL